MSCRSLLLTLFLLALGTTALAQQLPTDRRKLRLKPGEKAWVAAPGSGSIKLTLMTFEGSSGSDAIFKFATKSYRVPSVFVRELRAPSSLPKGSVVVVPFGGAYRYGLVQSAKGGTATLRCLNSSGWEEEKVPTEQLILLNGESGFAQPVAYAYRAEGRTLWKPGLLLYKGTKSWVMDLNLKFKVVDNNEVRVIKLQKYKVGTRVWAYRAFFFLPGKISREIEPGFIYEVKFDNGKTEIRGTNFITPQPLP